MAKETKNSKKVDIDDEEDDSKIFPQRLMEILADERSQESISWLPHGRAFMIKKRDLFAEQVMPRYFSRKAKYSSFTRKLNRWNFVRVSSGPELGAYYHEFFLRDKPHLAAQMFCRNARTMLAMQSNGEAPSLPSSESKPAPPQLPDVSKLSLQSNPPLPTTTQDLVTPSLASAVPNSPVMVNGFPITPALLAALTKDPSGNGGNSKMASYAPTNIRLLEMHLAQQEQANRILYEHAMALSLQQRQEQQSKLLQEQQRLSQMRQLIQLRQQQRDRNNPTSNRASAA